MSCSTSAFSPRSVSPCTFYMTRFFLCTYERWILFYTSIDNENRRLRVSTCNGSVHQCLGTKLKTFQSYGERHLRNGPVCGEIYGSESRSVWRSFKSHRKMLLTSKLFVFFVDSFKHEFKVGKNEFVPSKEKKQEACTPAERSRVTRFSGK